MSDRQVFHLHLRSRLELFKGGGEQHEVEAVLNVPASQMAMLLCDVWDRHWCPTASARVDELAPVINEVVSLARDRGVQIIHAPSDTLAFYADSPHRQRMISLPRVGTPEPVALSVEPPLPIDDADGGCDAPPEAQKYAVNTGVWTRQHPAIEITGEDVISDNGAEIYSLLHAKGISYLVVLGVHTNMCVLGRSFGIRQMTRWGVRCMLMRDLTDAMYNPAMAPHVDHFTGTGRVIEHIERYWCPTLVSTDFTGRPPFRFREDPRS